ncbi:uncharacterized protein K02A2.6-like [Liolophura sinensis]|uniref:uncharacterized protein K02A2.6-like n=1 Tax=Liolophura sinensis TaxID=3198878 RepID=UPI00315845E1
MIKDITDLLSRCDTCNTLQHNQQKETLISHEILSRPWEKVGCDLFEFDGKDYLILVDYYSDYFEIDRLHAKTATTVIKMMKSQFARHGIPVQLISDNGRPFSFSEFKKFADKFEFEHITSSPRYPQSNGKVGRAVKTVKQIIAKCLHAKADPFLTLLKWRNTPTEGIGSSSVQRLFGRRTRTLLTATSEFLKPKTIHRVADKLASRKLKQARYYNRSSRDLPDLQIGDVRLKAYNKNKQWQKAIVGPQVDIRSYSVKTEDGRRFRRNRRDLRASKEYRPDVEIPYVSTPTRTREREDSPVRTTSSPLLQEMNPERPSTISTRTSSGRVARKPARFQDCVSVTIL